MRPLRVGTLQWAVGAFCGTIGALMLVAPHQFGSPTYAALRPLLNWWGILFALAGVGLLVAGAAPRWHLVAVIAHQVAGFALILVATQFAATGGWFGTAYYGVLGLGCIGALLLPRSFEASGRRTDLLAVLMGLSAILSGASMLLVPGQFSAPVFDPIRPHLAVVGVAFLLVGLALAVTEVSEIQRSWIGIVAHLSFGILFWTLLFLTSLPQRIWTGVAFYGGFGTLIAIQPWVDPLLRRIDRDSLRLRLAISFAVISALPMLAIVAIDTAREERQVTSEIVSQQRTLADALAHNVDDFVGLHRAAVAAVADQLRDGAASPEEQSAMLRALARAYPDIVVFATYDRVGVGVARSDEEPIEPAAGFPAFEEARRTGQPTLDVLAAPLLGGSLFIFGAPMISTDGAFQGLVVGGLESQRLAGELAQASAGFGGSAYLVDERGRMVASPRVDGTDILADLSEIPPVSELRNGSGAGSIRYRGPDGDTLAAFSRVPSTGWGLIVERPADAALAGVRSGREIAFGVLILVVSVSAAIGWLATGWIAAPLSALARAANRLAHQDDSAPLPRSQISEVARLAGSFGEMRDRLGARSAELERAEAAQRFLAEAGKQLASSLDYETTLSTLTRLAVPALADACVVDLVQADGTPRRFVAHVEPENEQLLLDMPRRFPARQQSNHPGLLTLHTGQSRLVEFSQEVLREAATSDEHMAVLRSLDYRWGVYAPLVARGRTLGVIGLITSVSRRRYGPNDLSLANELAGRAALAVDNARLYQEAQAAIRSRDEFLSIASHELRTPVAGIKGYAQLLLRALSRGPIEQDRLERSIGSIQQAADRLAMLTQDLLDVSRIRLGKLPLRSRRIDLCELVREVVDRIRDGLDSRHRIRLDAPAEICTTVADADRLDQVFTNLLENAVKYSPDGGEVSVTLEVEDGQAKLRVRDSGIGLPTGTTESIFEPFGRAPNAAANNVPGMGLGLYICRNIVERHCGRIWVESDGEGHGTTVHVVLPVIATESVLELVDA